MQPKPPGRPRRPRKTSPEDSPLARTVLLEDEAAAQFVAEQVSRIPADASAARVDAPLAKTVVFDGNLAAPAERPLSGTIALDDAAQRAAGAPALPFVAQGAPSPMSYPSAVGRAIGSAGGTLALTGEPAEPLWMGHATAPPAPPAPAVEAPAGGFGDQFLEAMAAVESEGAPAS